MVSHEDWNKIMWDLWDLHEEELTGPEAHLFFIQILPEEADAVTLTQTDPVHVVQFTREGVTYEVKAGIHSTVDFENLRRWIKGQRGGMKVQVEVIQLEEPLKLSTSSSQ
jgi:hypothetical protein